MNQNQKALVVILSFLIAWLVVVPVLTVSLLKIFGIGS